MKSTAVLINIARGPIVDEVPLWSALQNERIGRGLGGGVGGGGGTGGVVWWYGSDGFM